MNLNNSHIRSIRDIGSHFINLSVLWMARCHLRDLNGIGSLSNLKELYLAYNKIKELNSISMLEDLEILDLEGLDCATN